MKKRTASKSRRAKTPNKTRQIVIQETTRIETEPVLEIRKPATLSQALTERAVAVVKPEGKRKVERKVTRRVA